ncbi:MAG: tetratricopeptide repeat protein [Acidobacteriota bacterium]
MLGSSGIPMRQKTIYLLALPCLLGMSAKGQPAVKTPPLSAEARLARAREFLQQQRRVEALEELGKALAGKPGAEVRFQAGKLLRGLAESRLEALREAAPRSAGLSELAGDRHERLGQFAEALAEYREAAKLEADRPGLHYRLGNVLWKMREVEAAIGELNRELALSPHHGMANLRLGQAWMSSGEEERALGPLEAARASMPESIEARRDLGKAYRKLNRNEEARREWEYVARAKPEDEQVHYLLSGVYRDLGQEEKAQEALARHRGLLEQRRARAGKE